MSTDQSQFFWLFPLSDRYQPAPLERNIEVDAGETREVVSNRESGLLHGPLSFVSDSPNVLLTIRLSTMGYIWEIEESPATLNTDGRVTPRNNGLWVDLYDTASGRYVVSGTFLFLPYGTSIVVRLRNIGTTTANVEVSMLRYRIIPEDLAKLRKDE